VREGGGLLVLRSPAYQFGGDIERMNQWLEPCGAKILPEQVVDESNRVRPKFGDVLYWTRNTASHRVTEGVRGIFYPDSMGAYRRYTDYTSPVAVSDDWEILVRGMDSAASMFRAKGGELKPLVPGACSSAPALLAVRDYGKGRIAVWPIATTAIWQDGYHLKWGSGSSMDGEIGGKPGDAQRLLGNLFTYLSEPSRGVFGGYASRVGKVTEKGAVPPGYEPLDWDTRAPDDGTRMPHRYVGLIGAQSALSTGQGTPEEFIEAAKAAGYDFIAFAEDLRTLSEAGFEQLKTLCAAHSKGSFRAYPGFLYHDDSNNAWITFSDRLFWPKPDWWSETHEKHLRVNNIVARGSSGWPPIIWVRSHRQPETPWQQGNFKVFSIYTYENGKLVDDALDDYRRVQWQSYKLAPVAVHLVSSPEAVMQARKTGFQTHIWWYDADVVTALSGHYCRYQGRYVFVRSSFVSEGPVFENCGIMNMGTSDLARPGGDRLRMHIRASSPVGLREVLVLDGETPRPWRRFLPGGEKNFSVTFDHFHDRQYSLHVVLVDGDGRRAISWENWTNAQENYFVRCSDNLNTIAGGKWRHLPEGLGNRRGIEDYTYHKRGLAYNVFPRIVDVSETERPAVEYYPRLASRFGSIIDCRISSHHPPSASANLDKTDNPELAVANKAYAGEVRLVFFTPRPEYPAVLLVEGEFRILQDLEAKRVVVCNSGTVRGSQFCFTAEDGTVVADGTAGPKPWQGVLPYAGCVGIFPDPFKGALGVIALQPGLRYTVFGGSQPRQFTLSLDVKGGKLAAGQTLSYRYLQAFSALAPDIGYEFLDDVCRRMGLRGTPAYAVEPVSGSVVGTEYVLRLKAERHGFSGRVKQADLPLDLPVMIEGLNPQWDAGIWYRGDNTLMVPEYRTSETGERSVQRTPRAGADQLIHIPVMEDGTGFLQIDTEVGDKDVYIGNFLVCDSPDVTLTLVDTRPASAACTVHNPTGEPVTCTVEPGSSFTLLGRFAKTVTVAAGSSVRVPLSR